MSTVMRCKMKLHGVSEPTGPEDNKLCRVDFGPVYSSDTGNPDDENAMYGKYTPSGQVWLNIVPAVAQRLIVGREYYVDFTEAAPVDDNTEEHH